MDGENSILDLKRVARSLPPHQRALFNRIYRVDTAAPTLIVPPAMEKWIESTFGHKVAVMGQRVVRVTNLVTLEGSIFNPLRSMRPTEAKEHLALHQMLRKTMGDPFCDPINNTPEDVFGRIRSKHCTTASSVAKFDGFHSLIIFDEHNPLNFSAESIGDYIDTGLAWSRRVHEADNRANYFFLVWNCLWRGGATILHGHAHVTMASGMHYAKIEHLRRATLHYQERYRSNYFEDLCNVHSALGLTAEMGSARVLAYLTPIAKDEVLLLSEELNQDLRTSVYQVLWRFTRQLGVRSFNLALYMPPIGRVEEDWEHFPLMVRLVDRGDLGSKTCDLNGMDLYASSVISSDPFELAALLRDEPIRSGVEGPGHEQDST